MNFLLEDDFIVKYNEMMQEKVLTSFSLYDLYHTNTAHKQ